MTMVGHQTSSLLMNLNQLCIMQQQQGAVAQEIKFVYYMYRFGKYWWTTFLLHHRRIQETGDCARKPAKEKLPISVLPLTSSLFIFKLLAALGDSHHPARDHP